MTENLIGRVFNQLEVIERDTNSNNGKARWICKCDCGKITGKKYTYDLKSGRVKSCGCLRNKQVREALYKDLSKQSFERLLVLRLDSFNENHKAVFLCRCECGKECLVVGNNLQNGDTKSCGCLREENLYTGDNFIRKILLNNDISFKTEYSFLDLKSNKNVLLRFDFAIFNLDKISCLIEFQGEQHDKYIPFMHKNINNFMHLQENDKLKIDYCLRENISLYIIPWEERNKINNLNELLSNKYKI